MQQTPAPNAPSPVHSEQDAYLLLKVYNEKRLRGQQRFYQARLREFQINSDVTFILGIALSGLATILAALNSLNSVQWIAVIIAILPTLGALLVSFQQIYDWDRQSTLYSDAMKGLKRISDNNLLELNEQSSSWVEQLQEIVVGTENVLETESDQWGQLAFDQSKDGGQKSLEDFLGQYAAASQLTQEQQERMQHFLESVRQTVNAPPGTVPTIPKPDVPALGAGSNPPKDNPPPQVKPPDIPKPPAQDIVAPPNSQPDPQPNPPHDVPVPEDKPGDPTAQPEAHDVVEPMNPQPDPPHDVPIPEDKPGGPDQHFDEASEPAAKSDATVGKTQEKQPDSSDAAG